MGVLKGLWHAHTAWLWRTHGQARAHKYAKDLVEDRYGTSVRLEQERVRFSQVERALEPWMDAT